MVGSRALVSPRCPAATCSGAPDLGFLVHLGVIGGHLAREEVRYRKRWLFVSGGSGSGKSAVLRELGVRSAKARSRVLIVCPTGQPAQSFKFQLSEVDGTENVQVGSVNGALRHKCEWPDENAQRAPPSALRRIDFMLVDEASQCENQE